MPSFATNQMAPLYTPGRMIGNGDGSLGGRLRRFTATIVLNALNRNNGVTEASIGLVVNDDVLIAKLPPYALIDRIEIVSTVSLGTSTLNFGFSQTHASNTALASGITHTSTTAPTVVATPAMRNRPAETVERDVFMTVGTANITASANTVTVTLWYVAP